MKCKICGSESLIFDRERGIYVCINCASVDDEPLIDQGPEWRAYTTEDKVERERTGSPLTAKVHDFGITTKIGYTKIKDRIKVHKLRLMQNKIRVSARERKLVTYLSVLNSEASKLNLPEHVKETASILIRRLIEEGKAKRVEMYALIAAVIYYSCQVNRIPKLLNEIKTLYSLSQADLWKALEKVQEVAKSVKVKPNVTPIEYIPKITERLGLPAYVSTKASELVDIMYKNGLTSGKGYTALAAASVYLISTLMDVKKTQKEIADSLSITEVTIRNRYREIIKAFDIEVKL
ncbi:transcription initiation factor IIB [Sulfolobus acidocaldarius]|uniref:Transcription initiation factor IIB n=4 Tax=Sulfolobus acidocaldarius TaxID=2285 RepID=Q4J949_SULAC|nr:transcription initiation factor IIB family protein [Sulfolobus acidocaldarius]AAY80676.1 transcription initiation factor B [Sulfolobus acidocaldarius DSM 639]AGE71273.1 transcription initiation factor B [Sulfolobus acidocaldarius N8]AGE73542.1 transcription initiation factor B [Sulfolobus acidocaldarius Ron12/I]ALU30465.1 transcription initiation factor IIB 2 [Sulfolobus acidocaldarius]ALU31187.1 transcription initiation factor IIB 2 [Sulfolobus acidocaldarius]